MIAVIILLLSSPVVFSQMNSAHIVMHDKVTIFTDPQHGSNSFVKWGLFPPVEEEIRRITMAVTLAHPDDRAIAHWDYLDRIKIRRSGGVNGKNLNYEIGRLLTPYGSNFTKEWSFTWQVDVTDFAAFMRDSVEIEYIHTGYESPDLGWDLTIDFKVDFGPPVAEFIAMETLWEGSFAYGDPARDIEDSLAAKEIVRATNSSFGRLRIQHTGHGMDRPRGCSEFCSRWREIVVDGQVVDHRDIWKECGDNPLYPQGGTWIYDRGYWCPGDLQPPDIIDVPLTRASHIIDLNMEPYTAQDVQQPREAITCYFFQFAELLHANDVAIEEIIVPNKTANYNRLNPSVFHPRFRIRNLGKENLRTLNIIYKTDGFEEKTLPWHGDLAFFKDEIVTLPGTIDAKAGVNAFAVVLANPNGVRDEWGNDNRMESEFYDIPTLPTKIVVELLTNNKPEENTLFIVNSADDTVFFKSAAQLEPASNYSDTLTLAEGNYFIMLTDSAGDGLEFWAHPEAGYGRLRLKDIKGNIIHIFESDCGNGQFYAFRCDEDALVDTTVACLSVNIFPRMVTDHLTIYVTIHKSSTLKIRITKDGEYVEEHEYTHIKDSPIGMDVEHLQEGRYVMEIYVDGEHKMSRRFNKQRL
ncbi:peptide-N-glycosidase [candidate division KSB1 bacterium]|nr:peptide-N-glycosidase [candidate division KSB1 bacterium]